MAKRITDEQWDALVKAYISDPGNAENARLKAGVAWKTAIKAWNEGFPRLGRLPIYALVEEHQLEQRALVAAEAAAKRAAAEKEAEDARNAAVQARKQESQMVQLARGQSLQCLAVAGALAQTARKLALAIVPRADVEIKTIELWTAYYSDVLAGKTPITPAKAGMDLRDVTVLLERIARVNRDIVMSAEAVMTLERMYLGAPTQILGVAVAGVGSKEDLSMDELEVRITAAAQAMEAVRRASDLRLLQGGKGEDMSEEQDFIDAPNDEVGEAV